MERGRVRNLTYATERHPPLYQMRSPDRWSKLWVVALGEHQPRYTVPSQGKGSVYRIRRAKV